MIHASDCATHNEPALPVGSCDCKSKHDEISGRLGRWMHTSTGKRFFPQDPRPEDICISDIANGLALDCRYGGQGRVDCFYSVAEHSVHMARYAMARSYIPKLCLAVLLHDAAEAYLNDLPAAVKHAVNSQGREYDGDGMSAGDAYSVVEDDVLYVILKKYDVASTAREQARFIKDLDRRIVPLEKTAIMRHPQPWAHDQYAPLEGIEIECWPPDLAKIQFLICFHELSAQIGLPTEEVEWN